MNLRFFYCILLLLAGFMAKGQNLPISFSLEGGGSFAIPKSDDSQFPPLEKGNYIRIASGTGWVVGGQIAFGGRGQIYTGGRFVNNSNLSLVGSNTYAKVSGLAYFRQSRVEVPIGYSRNIPISPKTRLNAGVGLVFDFFGEENYSYFFHHDGLVAGYTSNSIFYFNWEGIDQKAKSAIGTEIQFKIEHRISSNFFFYWGTRLQLSPTLVLEGNIEGFDDNGNQYSGKTTYNGTSFSLYTGFGFGQEFEDCRDCGLGDGNGNRTVFLEWGGQGYGFSLNFDRRFYPFNTEKISLAARVGLSGFPNSFLIAPMSLSALFGGKNHHFETSVGTNVGWVVNDDFANINKEDFGRGVLHLAGGMGYRFQKPERGIFLRVGGIWLTETFNYQNEIIPYLGAGYSF